MKIMDDGTLYLEKGEAMPMQCPCGCIYQPAKQSRHSTCPRCRRHNDHANAAWQKVSAPQ